MIKWPDIKFPPVNLYSAPNWPPHYLELESEFCKEESDSFFSAKEGSIYKEVTRQEVLAKRKRFNKLWNARAEG